MLGGESEGLSYAPVSANNKFCLSRKVTLAAPLVNKDNYLCPSCLIE